VIYPPELTFFVFVNLSYKVSLHLHASLNIDQTKNIIFRVAVLLCWVTQDFELYAAFDPLADKVFFSCPQDFSVIRFKKKISYYYIHH